MVHSFGFLSTHPPTHCGLATFNSSLVTHLTATGVRGGVVRVGADGPPGPDVVHTWSKPGEPGWSGAADALNAFDVAVVQHEYGIYPGPAGADLVPLLHRLTVPSMVILHTVLAQPSPAQKALLEEICAAAGAIVTMTGTARDRLLLGYAVDAAKVTVIPHGAAGHADLPVARNTRPHLLTWGLLGPGKGIEWALRAVARLRPLNPRPVYTVAGRTHPKVLETDGEAYRGSLRFLAEVLGITADVRYEPEYHDDAALGRLIRSADVVMLPYDSREQVSSGVLVEAVAAGVPVVATPFPHAVELLTDGPGLLVPHRDPVALAAAVRRILTEPDLAATLSGTRPKSPTPRWPAVADSYRMLGDRLLAGAAATAPA